MPEDDEAFCSNPRCVLHCSARNAEVSGRGEWATLANGLTYARVRLEGRHYCHVCARDPASAPGVRIRQDHQDRHPNEG